MDADELYGLALDEFIPARGALAKELRKAGRRDEAAEVAARRKPSVAAWAVNQLVRTQRPSIKELFGAGDELREAQSDLLAGRGDGRALRSAGDRERAAVEDLVERARGLLSSAGNELSASVIDRVSDTLHAAALDEDAREEVREGRLERELRHAGLGFGLGAGSAPEPKPRGRASAKEPGDGPAGEDSPTAAKPPRGAKRGAGSDSSKTKRAERERAAADREVAERARRERAAARRDARAAHASAKRRADAATRALRSAEGRRDQAARELSEADEALAAAREDAAGADEALRRAQGDLDAAQRPS